MRARSFRTLGVLAGFVLTGCAPGLNQGGVRLPDGRRLHLSCTGQGSPVVLLESGFGADLGAWYKVQPELAKITRVCAYDRAGYGQSDAGPAPRDGAAVALDLDEALRAARVGGPFVAVGHSAGGLYVRIFADRRPREVVGMVLVDPSVEHQDRAFAMFGPNAASLAQIRDGAERCLVLAQGWDEARTPGERNRCFDRSGKPLPASLWETEMSELDTLWGATSDEAASGRPSYGAMPLIVLTAADTYKGAPEPLRRQVDARWRGLHQAIAQRSSHGEERLVSGSSHLIMLDRPDAIVQAVKDILQQVRTTTGS